MGKKKFHGGIRLEFKQPDVPKSQKSVNAQQNRSATAVVSCLSGSSNAIDEAGKGELDYESPLEKMIVKVNDRDSLVACIEAWEAYLNERNDTYAANINVSYEEFEALIRNKKLDANLTKCTKFVKKLRAYTESQRTSVESDIKSLNLSKYHSEIASALVESKLKLVDIREITAICSMLHKRYADFSTVLTENCKRILPGKKIDVASISMTKLTVDFRLFAELILSGVISISVGFPLLLSSLKNMIAALKDGTQGVIPIVFMCRALGYEITGVLPKNIRKLSDKNSIKMTKSTIIPEDKKLQMLVLLKEFYTTQTRLLLNIHEGCLHSEMHNRRLMKTKGELPPDRVEAHSEITSKFDKFLLNIKKLAYIMDFDVPELRSLPAADPDEEKEKPILNEEGQEATVPGIILFDDEETRSFYQDFPDLKMYLPPLAYRETILQSAKESEAVAEREKEASNVDEEIEKAELTFAISLEDLGGEPEENELPPSMRQATEEEKDLDKELKPSFKTYLDSLKNSVNRNMVDKAAFEFVEKFNNKQNRKKLARTIFHIPRQRTDLLPLWSRLVAILSPVMPDLSLELCTMLMKDFQYLLKKKHQIFIETKLKITRLIAELVNFKVFPKSDALYCLKLLLMDFVHHQIEMCCAFVETCGRFLHRHPESYRRFQIYLDEMIRKKTVKALEPRYLNLVDHAYNFVARPKEVVAPKAKKLPCLEAFIQKIVWYDLEKDNVEQTIEILRSLEWETDPETRPTVIKILSNPGETSYNRLPHLASVIAGLCEYRSEVGVKVLDRILEDVKVGMDDNNVIHNQRRITVCVFFGQLYLYRVASGMQVFTVLYDFISYGVKTGRVQRGTRRVIDRPEDLFRIRLACQVLKVCGEYFNHGSTKKTLDTYIKYLQRYYWTKRMHPYWAKQLHKFPYGILEDLEETIKRIRPHAKIYKNWDEAEEAVREMEKEIQEAVKSTLQNSGYNEVTAMKNLPPEIREIIDKAQEERMRQNIQRPMPGEIVPQGTKSSRELEPIVDDPYLKYENAHDSHHMEAAEDAAFLRELEKLCSQVNYEASRDGGKHMTSAIPIPLQIRSGTISTPSKPSPSTTELGIIDDPQPETVDFTMITRKGNKQQYKTLPVPVDSDFVVNLRTREETERAEKERVKKITLGMNDLQLAEEEKMLNTSHFSNVRKPCL